MTVIKATPRGYGLKKESDKHPKVTDKCTIINEVRALEEMNLT